MPFELSLASTLAILGDIARAGAVLVAAWLAMRLGRVLIHRAFQLRPETPLIGVDEKRAKTLAALLTSVLRYAVSAVAMLTILGLFIGPQNISAVLGAAGIAGLAIGFGAQNLVRDVIGGFFLLYEDQYQVGEHVIIGDVEGLVEEIGLRVTQVRDFAGNLHFIPNGTITQVANRSRGNQRVMFGVDIAYEEDVDRAVKVLEETLRAAAADLPAVVEGPTVLGVSALAESGVTITVWAKTVPGEQWAVEREFRRRIKQAFDRAGIEIPYPRRVMVPPEATKVGRALAASNRPAETGKPEARDPGRRD